jgi:crotonobetainyl-CoA:carnitine CoA-transferase CaiB-like acyl-CoA transferase
VPPVSRFLLDRTKQQLFAGAIERRILLFPVSTLGDILVDPQLEARKFFQAVPSPEFDATLTVLGPFARASATPLKSIGRAPRLGQHNADIYMNELGLARSDLIRLTSAGVI